jgi:hypothetical protein
LIPLSISWFGSTVYVRRQRNLSVFDHDLSRCELATPAKASESAAQHPHDFDDGIIAEPHGSTKLELPTGVHHGQPGTVGLGVDQQHLRLSAALSPSSESCWDHAAHIAYEHITRVQQGGEIVKHPVRDGACIPIDDQQPACRTILEGMLGN